MSFITSSAALDWADTAISNYNTPKQWRDDESYLKKLITQIRRANTCTKKVQKELESHQRFSWFKPEYEKPFKDRIAKYESQSLKLQLEYADKEADYVFDRIQKIAETADLINPHINFNVAFTLNLFNAAHHLFFAKEEAKTQQTQALKMLAISGAKLVAKAALDYAFPQVSPYVSYALINAGEKACYMLADWSGANLKKDVKITALKIGATMAVAHAISSSASLLRA